MRPFNFFNRSKPDQVRTPRRSYGMSGGTYVSEDTSMQSSAFHRGVIYISSQIAKLPWDVKDDKNNKIKNDIYFLLNVAPNEEMTAMFLKLFLIQCALVGGMGYAEIERNTLGRPIALWPLNPKKILPIRDSSGKLFYQILSGGPDGETVYLQPKDIFIVKNLHTRDALTGEGIVGYAMNTLGISLGSDKFANALYANGAMPSGVLTYPGRLDDDAALRLKESWESAHGGRKTGSTALLEDGVEYKPLSHSPDVLQFIESRKFTVLELARFFGIPPTKLFDSDAAKFNNIEHANLEVATDTLDAWARNLESEADVKLLNNRRGDLRTEFDLYAVFRGDMTTRSTYFKNMMATGSITPNEIRMKEGEAPYAGGNRFYIATNNFTPSDRMDEVIDSQIKKNEPVAPAQNDQPNQVDQAVAQYLISKSSN